MTEMTIRCEREQYHSPKHPRPLVAKFSRTDGGPWERERIYRPDGDPSPIARLSGNELVIGKSDNMDPVLFEDGNFIQGKEPVRENWRLVCPRSRCQATPESYHAETLREVLTLASNAGKTMLTTAEVRAIVEELSRR